LKLTKLEKKKKKKKKKEMSAPPIQLFFDSNGRSIDANEFYNGFGNNMDHQAQDEFNSFNQQVNSTMKWATVASVGKLIEMFES
jgi:hypothetical protein